ncbi:MAG: zinc-dependent alcohol dehydrogenase family protein [Myxococcales bacterium]|nr:zinc-dependent alcohol dehydrogenase family protein [Myxococcales bacterium]
MRAMILRGAGEALALEQLPDPEPQRGQVLVRVIACGVCRTDLHILDGELPDLRYPIIPGHQIVGEIVALGDGVSGLSPGDRVGVPWLGWTCGECSYCRSERENLCEAAKFTGCDLDGGFAELCCCDARYCFALPAGYPALQVAPLLCGGLIGYRAYRLAGEDFSPATERAADAPRLGLYGFGSAAHMIAQVARFEGRRVFAFTRAGDSRGQAFARQLGAEWAGSSDDTPPEPLDAAIIFAPVGALVPLALKAVAPGGSVVCAGIHMSDIPSFPYRDLWRERVIRSVANLTRADGEALLALAPRVPIETTVSRYALEEVNQALDDLRAGRFDGSAVIEIAV